MLEKDHPTFKRQYWTVFLSCFAGLVLVILIGSSGIGQLVLPAALWVLICFSVFFGLLFYVILSKKHIKCPDCSSRCSGLPDSQDKEQRVFCDRCQTIWRLGIFTGTDTS